MAQIANAASPASIPEMMRSNLSFKDIKDYGTTDAGSSAVTGITSFTLFAAIQRPSSLRDWLIFIVGRWVIVHTTPNAATVACTKGTAFQSTGEGRRDTTPPVSKVFHSFPQLRDQHEGILAIRLHDGRLR
jgi:hypothetical protein